MELPRRIRWVLAAIFLPLALIASVLIATSWWACHRESKTGPEAAPKGGRFIQASDVRVFIQELGPEGGPVVLLIHGTGAWSEIWRETLVSLAKEGFRAVAIDVPPFGYSDKPMGPESYKRETQAARIVGILDALGISRVTL